MATSGPEPEVLRRAMSGDESAFAAVVNACGGLVLNLAWRMVRDRQEAEDLSQEVFLRLHRAFDRYDPSRPFLPWFRRLAVNMMINRTSGKAKRLMRRSASLDAIREDAGDLPRDPRSADAVEAAGRSERAVRLDVAMGELRPEYRAVLALRYFDGLSYEEIADTLELPLGTVKNRIHRAREALARVIGEDPR